MVKVIMNILVLLILLDSKNVYSLNKFESDIISDIVNTNTEKIIQKFENKVIFSFVMALAIFDRDDAQNIIDFSSRRGHFFQLLFDSEFVHQNVHAKLVSFSEAYRLKKNEIQSKKAGQGEKILFLTLNEYIYEINITCENNKCKISQFNIRQISTDAKTLNENKLSDSDQIMLVNIITLRVRDEPSVNGKILFTIGLGDAIEVIERTGQSDVFENINAEWYKIRDIEGRIGYVWAGYLTQNQKKLKKKSKKR